MTFPARVEAEILGLHRFLQAWFTAAIPPSPAAFSPLSQAWSAPMVLIAPEHDVLSADTLLETTRAQYGAFPNLSIEIRKLGVHVDAAAAIAVAVYEEWHLEPGEPPDGRFCSAVFVEDPSRPHAVRWVHVHESRIETA